MSSQPPAPPQSLGPMPGAPLPHGLPRPPAAANSSSDPEGTHPHREQSQGEQVVRVVGLFVVCVTLGLLLGMIGTTLHRWLWQGIPVGLILSLLACTSLVFVAGIASGSRLGALAAALGWVVVLVGVGFGWPKTGDVLVVSNFKHEAAMWTSSAWLYGGALLALALCALPYPWLCRWAQEAVRPRRLGADLGHH